MKNLSCSIAIVLMLASLGNGLFAQQEQTAEDQKVREGIRAMMLTSKAFRAASEKARPWLVTIESFGGVSTVQGRIGGIRKQGEGNTTGIVISKDGYILTSTFNFVQRPPIITIRTMDGQRRVADMVGRDKTRKICLLKLREPIDNPQLPELVDPDDLVVGQWAISVGVGFGDSNPAVSKGIVSATNRVSGRAVQTDANVSPANYGGPLIDIEGRLIGVCVPMNPQSQAVGAGVEWYDSGIGFAIPIHGLEDLLERLKSGEDIEPAFLGVQTGPNPGGKAGVMVTEVVEDSAAAEAGIEKEDVIVAIEGEKVKDLMELRQMLGRFESGQEIEVQILRDKSDEPDEPKTDEPDEPDEPKTDEPKADEPKADEPKADEPKTDEPKTAELKTLTVTLASAPAPEEEEGPLLEPPKIR